MESLPFHHTAYFNANTLQTIEQTESRKHYCTLLYLKFFQVKSVDSNVEESSHRIKRSKSLGGIKKLSKEEAEKRLTASLKKLAAGEEETLK